MPVVNRVAKTYKKFLNTIKNDALFFTGLDLPVSDIRKVVDCMVEIINDKAAENSCVKIDNLGVFGVRTWRLPEPAANGHRPRTTVGLQGRKVNYKDVSAEYLGATNYRVIFRPKRGAFDAFI